MGAGCDVPAGFTPDALDQPLSGQPSVEEATSTGAAKEEPAVVRNDLAPDGSALAQLGLVDGVLKLAIGKPGQSPAAYDMPKVCASPAKGETWWSKDGSSVLAHVSCNGNSYLYFMNAETGQEIKHNAYDSKRLLDVSPGTNRMVLLSVDDSKGTVNVTDMDGNNGKALIEYNKKNEDSEFTVRKARFSPSGKRLYVQYLMSDGWFEQDGKHAYTVEGQAEIFDFPSGKTYRSKVKFGTENFLGWIDEDTYAAETKAGGYQTYKLE